MSYYVYVLKTIGDSKITYVGYTKNIEERLLLHNLGKGAKFTRGRKWKLIYKETFESKSEAISREYYIKNNRTFRNKIKKNYK
jgi:putative endonuclease|tara:strand:+ start:504 stop:752 length:249 start_codon:yes stop_codon:yes gene_type:complete